MNVTPSNFPTLLDSRKYMTPQLIHALKLTKSFCATSLRLNTKPSILPSSHEHYTKYILLIMQILSNKKKNKPNKPCEKKKQSRNFKN